MQFSGSVSMRASFNKLVAAIKECVEKHNEKPEVFVWSAPADRILRKIAKCQEVLGAVH